MKETLVEEKRHINKRTTSSGKNMKYFPSFKTLNKGAKYRRRDLGQAFFLPWLRAPSG